MNVYERAAAAVAQQMRAAARALRAGDRPRFAACLHQVEAAARQCIAAAPSALLATAAEALRRGDIGAAADQYEQAAGYVRPYVPSGGTNPSAAAFAQGAAPTVCVVMPFKPGA